MSTNYSTVKTPTGNESTTEYFTDLTTSDILITEGEVSADTTFITPTRIINPTTDKDEMFTSEPKQTATDVINPTTPTDQLRTLNNDYSYSTIMLNDSTGSTSQEKTASTFKATNLLIEESSSTYTTTYTSTEDTDVTKTDTNRDLSTSNKHPTTHSSHRFSTIRDIPTTEFYDKTPYSTYGGTMPTTDLLEMKTIENSEPFLSTFESITTTAVTDKTTDVEEPLSTSDVSTSQTVITGKTSTADKLSTFGDVKSTTDMITTEGSSIGQTTNVGTYPTSDNTVQDTVSLEPLTTVTSRVSLSTLDDIITTVTDKTTSFDEPTSTYLMTKPSSTSTRFSTSSHMASTANVESTRDHGLISVETTTKDKEENTSHHPTSPESKSHGRQTEVISKEPPLTQEPSNKGGW